MVKVAKKNLVPWETANRIAEAVAQAEQTLERYSASQDLKRLSEKVAVDHIDVLPDVIFQEGDVFEGVCTFYVDLMGGDGDDKTSYPESFDGRVRGHFERDGKVRIDDLTVDVAGADV